MATLDTLIRLKRHDLNELRRRLAEADAKVEAVKAAEARLEAERIKEIKTAEETPEIAWAFAGYLGRFLDRRRQLAAGRAAAEREAAAARDAVAEGFREVKTYEIAARERQKRADAKLKRAEGLQMDELGVEGWRRRQAAGGF